VEIFRPLLTPHLFRNMPGQIVSERYQPGHTAGNGASDNGVPLQKQVKMRNGSIGAREAESHIPTLKNQGKSDCGVKIISILEARSDIPVEALSTKYSCMSPVVALKIHH
jgi:hypothetical protein